MTTPFRCVLLTLMIAPASCLHAMHEIDYSAAKSITGMGDETPACIQCYESNACISDPPGATVCYTTAPPSLTYVDQFGIVYDVYGVVCYNPGSKIYTESQKMKDEVCVPSTLDIYSACSNRTIPDSCSFWTRMICKTTITYVFTQTYDVETGAPIGAPYLSYINDDCVLEAPTVPVSYFTGDLELATGSACLF